MFNRWYSTARECIALRKHVLRVDLRVYIDRVENFTNQNDLDSSIKSILTAAIVKGLDVIGVVNNYGPQAGWRAQQLCREQNLDLHVVPGQEYTCTDKAHIIAFNIKDSLPPNLSLSQACEIAHKNNGLVMIANVGKRQAQEINKLAKGTSIPDAVEIYCAKSGGFQDIDVDFHRFITSGAASGTDLEKINAFTMIGRKDIEAMGLLPTGQGVEYTPEYLRRDDANQQGVNK